MLARCRSLILKTAKIQDTIENMRTICHPWSVTSTSQTTRRCSAKTWRLIMIERYSTVGTTSPSSKRTVLYNWRNMWLTRVNRSLRATMRETWLSSCKQVSMTLRSQETRSSSISNGSTLYHLSQSSLLWPSDCCRQVASTSMEGTSSTDQFLSWMQIWWPSSTNQVQRFWRWTSSRMCSHSCSSTWRTSCFYLASVNSGSSYVTLET